MGERSIPDVRQLFGRRETEEEKTVNELFKDIHLNDFEVYDDQTGPRIDKENTSKVAGSDWQQIERRLSMKKTIRKKIMRDLKQAFVEDPEEGKIQLAPGKTGEPNVLDLLKQEKNSPVAAPKAECHPQAKKEPIWKKFTLRSKSSR